MQVQTVNACAIESWVATGGFIELISLRVDHADPGFYYFSTLLNYRATAAGNRGQHNRDVLDRQLRLDLHSARRRDNHVPRREEHRLGRSE